MAKTDWTSAPAALRNADNAEFLTARQRVKQTVYDDPDVDSAAAAAAAGVKKAGYINYGAALTAYEGREDIETLASKQTRNAPADFDAAGFMRQVPNHSGGNGIAPGPDNAVDDGDFFTLD